MATERLLAAPRIRLVLAWVLTVLIIGVYLWIPSLDRTNSVAREEEAAETSERLDVVDVAPPEPYPGGLMIVSYVGVDPDFAQRVFIGKEELPLISRRPGALVARVPSDLSPGRAKVRVGGKGERSKPYDIRVEARDWGAPFRDVLGGLSLLVFGIGVFSRGAREAAGRRSADTLRRYGGERFAAFGFGGLMGGFSHSTMAAAALLAGLVSSNLISSVAAAAAFLGAQVGAALIPLITGLLDPRSGLLVIAVGVLWLTVARDRRTSAFARLAFGAGLVAFGLHLLRSGIEPLVLDKALLRLAAGLHADSVSGIGICVLIGVALAAILQGAASSLFVVVGLMQTVGQLDLRTVLAVLAGSGLGAALGALVTMRAGSRGRKLAQLHLVLGACSSLFAALTLDLWMKFAEKIAPSTATLTTWSTNVLEPQLSWQLSLTFAVSQITAALVVLPLTPLCNRALEALSAGPEAQRLSEIGDAEKVVRSGLLNVVAAQRAGLELVSQLVLAGQRGSGRDAEHGLSAARSDLEALLAGPLRVLPGGTNGAELRQAGFACLQLERSLEDLLFRAERFTDRQVALSARGRTPAGVAEYEATTREMHQLLLEGVQAIIVALGERSRIELDAARAREIRLNALEARSRRAALESSGDSHVIQTRLDILDLLDAYESAGNHVYRLAETLSGSHAMARMSLG